MGPDLPSFWYLFGCLGVYIFLIAFWKCFSSPRDAIESAKGAQKCPKESRPEVAMEASDGMSENVRFTVVNDTFDGLGTSRESPELNFF